MPAYRRLQRTHSGFVRAADRYLGITLQIAPTVLPLVSQNSLPMMHGMLMQDIAVRNAMVAFLVALAQTALPNATADVAVLNNFTVSLSASDSSGCTGPLPLTLTEALAAAFTAAVGVALLSLVPVLDTALYTHFSRIWMITN